MDYWTQNPEVLTQIGFAAKIFKFGLYTIIAVSGQKTIKSMATEGIADSRD
jgi:hypothetical protein